MGIFQAVILTFISNNQVLKGVEENNYSIFCRDPGEEGKFFFLFFFFLKYSLMFLLVLPRIILIYISRLPFHDLKEEDQV